MPTEAPHESAQHCTEHSNIAKVTSHGYKDRTPCLVMKQIVEHRPLRLASDMKKPVQNCWIRNLYRALPSNCVTSILNWPM